MRIIGFSHGIMYGGAQVCTFELAKLLKRLGVEVVMVVSERVNKFFYNILNNEGIPTYVVPLAKSSIRYPDMQISAVSSLIKSSDIAWITDDAYFIAPKIKKIKNIPVVAHLHGFALICPWWGLFFGLKDMCSKKCSILRIIRCKQLFNRYLSNWGLLEKSKMYIYNALDLVKGPLDFLNWPIRKKMDKIIENIDAFVAVSKAVKDLHLIHMPAFHSKFFKVIHPPIDVGNSIIDTTHHASSIQKIIYAGGDNLLKGYHVLIHAMPNVLKEFPNIKFLMIGKYDTDSMYLIVRQIRDLGLIDKLHKNIEFSNFLYKRSDFYKNLASAQVVVMPSISMEGFGRIAAEANIMGTPVVASRVGGPLDIVEENKTGLLSQPSDSDDLAKKIIIALSRKWERELIHKISVEKFESEKNARLFLRFVEKII